MSTTRRGSTPWRSATHARSGAYPPPGPYAKTLRTLPLARPRVRSRRAPRPGSAREPGAPRANEIGGSSHARSSVCARARTRATSTARETCRRSRCGDAAPSTLALLMPRTRRLPRHELGNDYRARAIVEILRGAASRCAPAHGVATLRRPQYPRIAESSATNAGDAANRTPAIGRYGARDLGDELGGLGRRRADADALAPRARPSWPAPSRRSRR